MESVELAPLLVDVLEFGSFKLFGGVSFYFVVSGFKLAFYLLVGFVRIKVVKRKLRYIQELARLRVMVYILSLGIADLRPLIQGLIEYLLCLVELHDAF